jgi:hypothetical protein
MHFSPKTQKDICIIFHQNALIVANEKIFFLKNTKQGG